MTAITAAGETIAGAEASVVAAADSTVALTWTAVANAVGGYKIYRGTAAGAENRFFTSNAASFTDDGTAPGSPGTPPVLSVQTALNTVLGAGSATVTAAGGIYTVDFGGPLAGTSVPTMTPDAGHLSNSSPYASLTNVRVTKAATQADHSMTGPVQAALDAAAISAGVTPGFLVSALIANGATPWVAPSVPFGAPAFVSQGPTSISGGQVSGMTAQSAPVAGAVSAVATNPLLTGVMWVGTVNGGIWKSVDALNHTPIPTPHWTSLLEAGPSMSIGALSLDPTDPTGNTLVAGIARVTNFLGTPSAIGGLLRTADGGTTWQSLAGVLMQPLDVRGVIARGAVLLAATRDRSGGTGGGIWRSADGGATFSRLSGDGVSGLPAGDAFDLVGDPSHLASLYTAIAGAGVFQSADLGATWTGTGGVTFGTATTYINGPSVAGPSNGWVAGQTVNLRLAVHDTGSDLAVYARVVNAVGPASSRESAVLRFTGNPVWVPLANPGVNGTSANGQGEPNFSIGADPTDANTVYVAGDTNATQVDAALGSTDFTGRVFRCQTGVATCSPIVNNATDDHSAPHADTRAMAFVASHSSTGTAVTGAGAKSGTVSAVAVGDGTLTYTTTGAAPAVGDLFQVGAGGSAEVFQVNSVAGSGPYVITLDHAAIRQPDRVRRRRRLPAHDSEGEQLTLRCLDIADRRPRGQRAALLCLRLPIQDHHLRQPGHRHRRADRDGELGVARSQRRRRCVRRRGQQRHPFAPLLELLLPELPDPPGLRREQRLPGNTQHDRCLHRTD